MKTFTSDLTRIISKSVALIAAITLVMLSCVISTFAQSGAGSIQGTVTDSTGAVIAGANIHVVNSATAVSSSTTTNSVGYYQVPALFTGTYTVRIGAPNMKTYETTIQLLVGQAAVINQVMIAGEVTQQVQVSANTVQLTTQDNGTISATMENEAINQLPMNGRSLASLVSLTVPGAEGTRVNGLFSPGLDWIGDGGSMTDREFGGNYTAALEPDPDAIQEVRIETNNSSAQYSTPGTVIMTTKSGANSMHGAFFETARNNGFGIARSRQDGNRLRAPKYVRNEFGASAGGPLVLPHVYHGKDKSFWFFAYERYSLSQISNTLISMPTTAMRSGDFSGLVNGSGVATTLYDPATTVSSANCNGSGTANAYCRTPFANNQIASNRRAPFAKVLYDMAPTPTTADNPLVTTNFTNPVPNRVIVPTQTFRLDHNFSEANKVYLRFTYNNNMQTTLYATGDFGSIPAPSDNIGAYASGYSFNPDQNWSPTLGYTHVFSPTFFAETILSNQWYSHHNLGWKNAQNYQSQLGLPNNFGESNFPNVTGGVAPWFGSQWGYGLSQNLSTINENLTKIHGHHQLIFGGMYRHERFGYWNKSGSMDYISYGGLNTALEDPASAGNYSATSYTGYGEADEYLGGASAYQVARPIPYLAFRDMDIAGYLQDNFHVNRRLTVNLGLRYEDHPGVYNGDGLVESFDIKNAAIVLSNPTSYYVDKGYTSQGVIQNMLNDGAIFETAQQAGWPGPGMQKGYNTDINPRVGFAYQIFGEKRGTILRASYGRYSYPEKVRSNVINCLSYPFGGSYTQSYTAANQSPDGLANYLLRAPQTVISGANSANVVSSATPGAILPGFAPWFFNPTYPPYFVTQINATLEQPLMGNSALRISWVYTHGTNLEHYFEPNNQPSLFVWEMQNGITAPNGKTVGSNQYAATAMGPYNQTTYGNITWDKKDGWSNDNALQVQYERLFHNGIGYQVNYVWSKPMRFGGNYFNDGVTYPWANYLGSTANLGTMTTPYGSVISTAQLTPNASNLPEYAETHAMNRWEGYKLDSAIPLQHIKWTGIIDLPVGRNKRFLGNSNRFVNALVGGFQLAYDGSISSQVFQPSGNWGANNPLKVYKHNAKITDCRSGVCHAAYEWFNGYLAPTVASGFSGSCTLAAKNVSGLPSSWVPFSTPIDTDCNKADAANAYYGSNEVAVTLLNGKTVPLAYSPGPTGVLPWRNTFLNGPMNWTMDGSLFKVLPIKDNMNLRINLDAFNVLNEQGYNNPSTSDGVESLLSSYNSPRQIQLTVRITF